MSHKPTISTHQHKTISASQKITSKMRYSMSAGTKNYFTSHISSYRVAMFDPWQCRAHNIGLRLLEYYSLNTYPIQALFVHLIPWHEFNVNNRHVRRVFLQPPKLADTKPNKKLGRFLDKICRGNPRQQTTTTTTTIYLFTEL